ncbi:hypothetical protein F0169_00575 [Pseudomonas sp. MAFF 212408]|uniref:Uncharacterized protein n=1 Tax=Pseudomonas kitaguniensis TaxID=2607908 RepID=A0A5N7KGI6_9PSED|nr:hypothetical protein [Pseudomonas kitaguniensis]MPR00691.1 hypothetical protein [Pseudomonas kitaguniensis]
MLKNLANNDLQCIEESFLLAVDHKACGLSVDSAKTRIKNLTLRLFASGVFTNTDLITHFEDMISDPEIELLARRESACKVINAAVALSTSLAGNGAVIEMYF